MTIRIDSIDDCSLSELRYMNARSGGGTEVSRLEIHRAHANRRLGDQLDGLICCSDLQGIVSGELLGVAVARHLAELADERVLPPAMRMGVLLAGDLYSVPAANKRGGYGDVAPVWREFAQRFAWVAGVAGNHDDVTGIEVGADVHLLDGDLAAIDGLRIGGVGRVIGNPNKLGRRDEDEHLEMIADVIAEPCDVVVLHEGPSGDDAQPGNAIIRELVEDAGVPLTVCGHCHWRRPLAELQRGQVLNVDARVVVLVGPA